LSKKRYNKNKKGAFAMIIIFGPAGSGKSIQGQILAARNGWRWLSAGQLLRDTHDPQLIAEMQTGQLVEHDKVNKIISEAITRANNVKRVIIDGFPRAIEQAKWLLENEEKHGDSVELGVVLEVPKSELMKRLEVRGRVDDTFEAIDERLEIYRNETEPILDYFSKEGIKIVRVDGTGSVGQVHDRIMEELVKCDLA
jgi:adenylate kinase